MKLIINLRTSDNFQNMKTLRIFLSQVLVCISIVATSQGVNDIYKGIEFEMPRVVEPTFSDYSVSITDFGAVGDAQTLNSE
ncbi:MAG: hypothetical protein HQ522_03110, partial [Bacteroidetes bacterium]|nr:hypothetical protein [Bacteroidota bacterium]